ncbi:hypothetical protein AABB24_032006, partial [Solanum stoloniferum]
SELTVTSRIKKWHFYIYISTFSCHFHFYINILFSFHSISIIVFNSMGSIHCRVCRTRVAFIEDLFVTVLPGGIFTRLVNVENVNYHESEIGKIIADTHCVQCGIMLGWKFGLA